ncbi:MAG TPA: hypothetical protein VIP29_00995 [Nitrososphaeraceae archaeon]
MPTSNLKAIAVTPANLEKLKDLGRAGDSMNSVIEKLLQAYEDNRRLHK